MAILGCKTEHQCGISLVTLEVEGKPTISFQGYFNLVETLISEAGKPHVAVILLTGPPERFFFGMNLEEIEKLSTVAAVRGATAVIQDMLMELENSPAVLICAVDGHCYGGGLEMILAFHIILATPSSMFGLPEIKAGTIPSYGGTQRLARIIGRNRALRVMLTGEAFSADAAREWGLVSEVLPRQDLLSAATKLARRLAGLSRPAVRALLNAAIGGLDAPMRTGLSLESMNSAGLAGSPDLKEGIRAFFEKRSPVFPSAIEGTLPGGIGPDHGN